MFLSTVVPASIFLQNAIPGGLTMPYNYTRGRTIGITINGQVTSNYTDLSTHYPRIGLMPNEQVIITIPDDVTQYKHTMQVNMQTASPKSNLSNQWARVKVEITHNVTNGYINFTSVGSTWGRDYDITMLSAVLINVVTINPTL